MVTGHDYEVFLDSFYDSEFLKINGFTKENAMSMYLPNSYNVFWDVTPEDFRELMLKNYKLLKNNGVIEYPEHGFRELEGVCKKIEKLN